MSSYHDGSRKADAMSGADTEGKEHRKSDILASERICVADFRLQSQLMPLSTSQSKLSEYFSSRKVWRLYSWDGVRLPSMLRRGNVDIPRLRAYKSRANTSRRMTPESAPGPTIPGPPKTPGTVDGEASGTCSPVGVALGTVSAGLKTLKNSQAKLCTARMARIPQR
jgi:hypothetical protein